ncbi:MAG: BCCT family transporter, partial [bacterium]|nr:BCCT family transporter [bacterium]
MSEKEDLDLTHIAEAYEDWEEEEERRREAAIRNRPHFEGLQVDPEIDFYPEVADREPGDKNIVKWGFDIHPQVTFYAAGFLLLFIAWTLLFPESAADVFGTILTFINEKVGWLYI